MRTIPAGFSSLNYFQASTHHRRCTVNAGIHRGYDNHTPEKIPVVPR